MKHLGISGGGTKIGGLFGAAETIILEKGYKPDIITGISAGAILSVPLALSKFDALKARVLNFDLGTFFNVSPVHPDGRIRLANALWRLAKGKRSLGEQFNLEKALSEIVPEQEFNRYKLDDSLAPCIVGSVDFYTGKRFYINLKIVDYPHFLKFVNASASIPIFTPGIFIDKKIVDFEGKVHNEEVLLYDGGVRDHSPTGKVLESRKYAITETVTLFSRPDRLQDILHRNDFVPKGILRILDRYVQITNAEVSKNDEFAEGRIIGDLGIRNHGVVFLPRILKSTYDVDKERLAQLYEEGKKAARQHWVEFA